MNSVTEWRCSKNGQTRHKNLPANRMASFSIIIYRSAHALLKLLFELFFNIRLYFVRSVNAIMSFKCLKIRFYTHRSISFCARSIKLRNLLSKIHCRAMRIAKLVAEWQHGVHDFISKQSVSYKLCSNVRVFGLYRTATKLPSIKDTAILHVHSTM